ncbi:hypothetical protein [Caenispirillum salinarum]|uniref:hypothetical protein n=1 Tax=Caenispirillum salinarum TaxID=859058 RepID=UPI00384D7D6B
MTQRKNGLLTLAVLLGGASAAGAAGTAEKAEDLAVVDLPRLLQEHGQGHQLPFVEQTARYAYEPPEDMVLNPPAKATETTYDLWGETLTQADAARDPARADPANGAVPITQDLLDLGQAMFYREPFGSERFFSDIVGVGAGAITASGIVNATLALDGGHTDNLRVPLASDVTVGGRTFRKGELIDTGFDVPTGAVWPIGLAISVDEAGRERVGITCALCHSAIDPENGKVIHGATNVDVNPSRLIAFAPNSTAFMTHTDIDLADVPKGDDTVTLADGTTHALPDAKALEERVDALFLDAFPGSTDTSVDLTANPTQIPDSFTKGERPYSWNGIFMAGPFGGLSGLTNNVHAFGADPTGQADDAQRLFDLPPEVYQAILLRNAANPAFRWDPDGDRSPGEVFRQADPTPGRPGLADVIRMPTWPQPSLLSLDGSMIAQEGSTAWREVNAMSAWQNTLTPPPAEKVSEERATSGRKVFEAAGCADCHSGPFLTNNRIIPLEEIGTNPSRATIQLVQGRVPPRMWAFDEPVPVREDAKVLDVPTDMLDEGQVALAFGMGDMRGGYAVPGLLGVGWSPPYLHDGSIAVGPDARTDLGPAGTVYRHVRPDARESLRALVDRGLRDKVIAANKADDVLRRAHSDGTGHEYWVDADAGVSADEQEALLDYLMSLSEPVREARAD